MSVPDEERTAGENGAEKNGGQVSQGPSSFDNQEAATGGADAVLGTPDATPSVRHGEEDPDLAGI